MKQGFPLTRYYNWLIFSVINPELHAVLKKYAHGKMADIACGEKPYAKMASAFVTEHIGIDHQETIHDKTRIDLIGTVYEIPAHDESFDSLLCTDVLEHVEEPAAAIAEAARILKSGGFGIYSVQFFWHIHESPRDFYRYSNFGLKYLFKKNGFEIIAVRALTGFCATFGQEVAYFVNQYRGRSKAHLLYWLLRPLIILIQGLAYLLGKIEKSEGFAVEYIAVGRKP